MKRISAIAIALQLLATGCFQQQTTSRSQVADDTAAEKEEVVTVGKFTSIGNVDPIPVFGVGLVHNLDGTGSSPTQDGYRTSLEQAIRRNRGNPKELLDNPHRTTSLVLVSTAIPPGVRAGERVDVAIALPPGSKTTSLKNGILIPCDLHNMDTAANVRQSLVGSGKSTGGSGLADSTVLNGHRLAVAEGSLTAGYDAEAKPVDEDGPKAGRIWGGVKNTIDRPYYFILNDASPQPKLAMVIAERLNSSFHAPSDKLGKIAEAKVQGKPVVFAYVPTAYRMNHGRFLLVARHVPLEPVATGSAYFKQLENDLLRPETALSAAIKLEALGEDSRRSLKVGLQSDSDWVRFASAEALAYLGHVDGAKELAELASKHPSLRTHCLAALASLDDAFCVDQLVELMKKNDATLRCGAFSALRAADENNDLFRGVKATNGWKLYTIPAESESLAHVVSQRHAEIVLFGSRFPLAGTFSFPIGRDFTISRTDDAQAVTISRISSKNGEPTTITAKTDADLALLLKGIATLGGSYADAVECVKRLKATEAIPFSVVYDEAPRTLSVQQLALISRSDPTLARANKEVERVGKEETGLIQASADLPTDKDGVQAQVKTEPATAPLNRDPGRLFGPRKSAETPESDKKSESAPASRK